MSKLIFGNTNATRDYESVKKLYQKFGKEVKNKKPNEKTLAKLRSDMTELMVDAVEGNERLVRLYENAYAQMTEDTILYSRTDVTSLIDELRARIKELHEIKHNVG